MLFETKKPLNSKLITKMSSSPPNPTTTTTTTTADFLKSVARHRPRKHSHPSIYQTSFYNPHPHPQPTNNTPPFPPQPSNSRPHHQPPPPAAGVLYPVASSGRGFLPKPNFDHNFLPNLHQTLMGTAVSVSANPKVVGQSSVAPGNSLKTIRDKNGDDNFVIIRDRKVQVSEGISLYPQCRSWLKNGFVLEKPPQYVDHVKSLPKALSASMVEPRNDDDMETDERTEDVEHLSAKDLLQQHVKHAKKVRARLRNQRLQRIERYKDRLALLLPPVIDQQPKTDPT